MILSDLQRSWNSRNIFPPAYFEERVTTCGTVPVDESPIIPGKIGQRIRVVVGIYCPGGFRPRLVSRQVPGRLVSCRCLERLVELFGAWRPAVALQCLGGLRDGRVTG